MSQASVAPGPAGPDLPAQPPRRGSGTASPAPSGNGADRPAPPRHHALSLTEGGATAEIALGDQVYTLRVTRAGKLILTK